VIVPVVVIKPGPPPTEPMTSVPASVPKTNTRR
jgi:hypothetical protein